MITVSPWVKYPSSVGKIEPPPSNNTATTLSTHYHHHHMLGIKYPFTSKVFVVAYRLLEFTTSLSGCH
jgi:hypothetical protein